MGDAQWDTAVADTEHGQFTKHTGPVQGSGALAWPQRTHPMIVTTSDDGTARVWDPWNPDKELVHLPLLGQGRDVAIVNDGQMAVATNRGLILLQPNHRVGELSPGRATPHPMR